MFVTKPRIPDERQFLAQVDRLVSSQTMHGSESLCRLLRYLAEHALRHPGAPPKEYQIATEVYGRTTDFDPQHDSTIRVQAGRLRVKMAEYYATEGADDPIVVELPKGTYLLSFHHHAREADKLRPMLRHAHSATVRTGEVRQDRAAPSLWTTPVIVLCILLLAALAVVGGYAVRSHGPASPAPTVSAAPALRTFWQVFVSGPEEPWVIFSNGPFVGRPETGMRYFNSERDSRSLILDHYTGVGEVLAVHELDLLFDSLQHRIHVKRGSLFTLDDAESNNLIFIGSPAENLTLRDVPNTREFVFQRQSSGERKGDLVIANVHPQAGEPNLFYATPGNLPLAEDYAVVGLVRGLNPGRRTMILAGTTTIGTQAAVEFVCRQSSVEELLLRLSVSQGGTLEPFETLLHVKVTRGVPVETRLVSIRKGAS
jgi:hypothetical protein